MRPGPVTAPVITGNNKVYPLDRQENAPAAFPGPWKALLEGTGP